MAILSKQDQMAISQFLREHLLGRVGIEVWSRKESGLVLTDRDPCTHCDDTVSVMRELVSLHAGFTFTPYDLDRHSDRASQAGIERAPTIVMRARGAELRFVGYPSGLLFPAFVDAAIMAGAGQSPLSDGSRRDLNGLPEPMPLELLVAPYDPISPQMMRLVYACGVESKQVRVTVTEMAEFPILAQQRQVTEVPIFVIGGRRFPGAFGEAELVEQIRRIASGDDSPVIRERVLTVPFVTAEQAAQMAVQQESGGRPPESPSSSGLFIPGR